MDFREKCEQIADECGVELMDVYDGEEYQEPFEDDGFLHICEGTQRAAFDVSDAQQLSRSEQNELTKEVLEKFGLKMTQRTAA